MPIYLSNLWINKIWYIPAVERHRATEGNKVLILIHASTWINLENMLNERSQSQKTTYRVILLA